MPLVLVEACRGALPPVPQTSRALLTLAQSGLRVRLLPNLRLAKSDVADFSWSRRYFLRDGARGRFQEHQTRSPQKMSALSNKSKKFKKTGTGTVDSLAH